MPLIHSGSKKAFKQNIETEMKAHPGRRDQNLAIAYSVARRAKKMAEGGMVNEDLDPQHEPANLKETYESPEQHLGHKAQDHEVIAEPSEPLEHAEPAHEDMGRNMDRIGRAVRMAQGGMVQEKQEADYDLSSPDVWSESESSSQASDEGFGSESMDNREGDEDQEEARRARTRRALISNSSR